MGYKTSQNVFSGVSVFAQCAKQVYQRCFWELSVGLIFFGQLNQMGPTGSSEMSSVNSLCTLCKNRKTRKQYLLHGESLKWRSLNLYTVSLKNSIVAYDMRALIMNWLPADNAGWITGMVWVGKTFKTQFLFIVVPRQLLTELLTNLHGITSQKNWIIDTFVGTSNVTL